MAAAVTISPGIFILVLCLQNILAQQCLSNVGQRNLAGVQQPAQKTTCGFQQMPQSGINYNTPQGTIQQTNFQHQSNIQQATPQQTSYLQQQQLNSQITNSQQPVNTIINSPTLQQQNPNLVSNIFSALYNIRQSQNQCTNSAKPNPTNNEQSALLQSQNLANPAFTASTIDKPQYTNQPSAVSNSFTDYSQFQPTFTFHPVSRNDLPSQQNQQMFVLPVHRSNNQNQDYTIQNQPMVSQQSPTVTIPGSQTNVPIVLTLQSPQTPSSNAQQPSTNSISQSNPIIYTVQTQPTSSTSQNQQLISNQLQIPNNAPLDNKSLISYVVSQLQNSSGSKNMLGSILPAMLNTKSEKSSSMKTLLPIILSVLNEKRNCCGCPHCGCNKNNNQNLPEPIINSGYSNQKNYSKQGKTEENLSETAEVDTSLEPTSNVSKKNENKDEFPNNIPEDSEEEEEEDLSEEESNEE